MKKILYIRNISLIIVISLMLIDSNINYEVDFNKSVIFNSDDLKKGRGMNNKKKHHFLTIAWIRQKQKDEIIA